MIFDLKKDLIGNDDYRIPRNMSRLVKFWEGKWLTSEEDGAFHFYNGFMNGNSGDLKKHKISILGLVLSYNQKTGGLELLPPDFEESKKFFPNLHDTFVWQRLASVVEESAVVAMRAERRETLANPPCHVQWSNSLRFDPTDGGGKCLHFTAATEGSLFVVFSALPKDKNTWYYVEITPERVAIYKVTKVFLLQIIYELVPLVLKNISRYKGGTCESAGGRHHNVEITLTAIRSS